VIIPIRCIDGRFVEYSQSGKVEMKMLLLAGIVESTASCAQVPLLQLMMASCRPCAEMRTILGDINGLDER